MTIFYYTSLLNPGYGVSCEVSWMWVNAWATSIYFEHINICLKLMLNMSESKSVFLSPRRGYTCTRSLNCLLDQRTARITHYIPCKDQSIVAYLVSPYIRATYSFPTLYHGVNLQGEFACLGKVWTCHVYSVFGVFKIERLTCTSATDPQKGVLRRGGAAVLCTGGYVWVVGGER